MKRGNATSDVQWDERKNRLNQRKHKVSFEEAATVFIDPLESLAQKDQYCIG